MSAAEPIPSLPLELPIAEETVRSLRAGQFLELTGTIWTARDAAHRYLADERNPVPFPAVNAVFYHCGPVVTRAGDGWRVTAAGPTTSSREEPYMARLIERFRLRGIIGKGGMGPATLAACRQFGCLYLHAVGGAAQVLASRIRRVAGVHLEQFGPPEAVWQLEVERFPVLVTMDAHGESLHEEVRRESARRLAELLAKP
ncbi:MAG: FumA C-terminus/TtdB family hydratase beta subunit [Lentisphaeria bacterium]|nr:FumA C-terminus/TtdB family hydratase beta subunit [Lentisphaeria bacterium]